jgi:serine/threonine-protein kinase HipA
MDPGLFPTAIWKHITRDHAGMLWVAGQRRLGRVRFTRPQQALPATVPLHLSEGDIARCEQGDALLAALLAQLTSLPGVSGVQPKLLLPLMQPATEPLRALADTHLLKGNRPEYPFATTVEAATLELARLCGLAVPTTVLSTAGKLLAVQRFDLDAAGAPIGFDEAASLMGLWARDKYSSSIEALHKSLLAFIPPRERHAFSRSLFQLLAFNLAVENGDAHLKNFGLLYSNPDAASLAPAYDLLTTTCFEGLARDTPALPLNGRKVWDDWQGFAELAVRRGLTGAEVRELLRAVLEGLEQGAQLPQRYAQRVPAAAETLGRMGAAWQRGYQRLHGHLHAGRAGGRPVQA